MTSLFRVNFILLVLLLGGCATVPPPVASSVQCTPAVTVPPAVTPPAPTVTPNLQAVDWDALPGWNDDQELAAWNGWLQSCAALQAKPDWQAVCAAAQALKPADNEAVRSYFQTWFNVYQSLQADGNPDGLITGYYEPLLHGSRVATPAYPIPLYAVPKDLLTIDLAGVYPELKNMRLRGRLEGNKVVPYLSRAEIDGSATPLAGDELVWVDNPVEAFFLQIQGSGRVQLPDGSMMRVGYADQNGYPYRSIGRVLVDRGELSMDQVSMQGIKAWGKKHPDKLAELLAQNPSFVFFKVLPDANGGPLGALGVPLVDGRSIAVDTRAIPLGVPVWLATTEPSSTVAMNRLVLAQDTGGAIRGNVRADFFWGFGDAAGKQAGMMKQTGRMWVLLPKTMTVPGTLAKR
ncbi:MAG: murein transglycosylase A [Sulfuriferula sp.]|nr:murein transglycosylase A [Sulfuriferula sp.]